jgi:aminomethyltransferase
VNELGKRTLLYELYKDKAHIGEFAGFDLPLWFEGIKEEVIYVREKVGLFDVSHLGRVIFSGRDAGKFLDYLTTNDILNSEIYQAKYSLVCNENGGIKDDIIVFRMSSDKYLVIWNAINHEKNMKWINENINDFNVDINNIYEKSFMIAIQGPLSEKILKQFFKEDLSSIKRFRGRILNDYIVIRTGYTGEDGFEIIGEDKGDEIWDSLISLGAKPCGLGARDVLRIEAGLPLYGKDINEDINPFEARLDFAVKMNKDFIGKKALLEAKINKRRMGIKMMGRSIPREDYRVYFNGKSVGYITSGTFSPILNCSIAMAYLPLYININDIVEVEIRGKFEKGIVVDFPFYDTKKYGWRREIK